MARAPRIAGRKLQQLRARLFRRNPLCVHCEAKGIVRLAVQRDHIIPVTKQGHDVESNTQGLCLECHDLKTRADLGYRKPPKQAIGIDGWPVERGGRSAEIEASSERCFS